MSVTIEQVLATLGIDRAEALAVGDRYLLIMRDPQVDEEEISVSSTIYLRIVDLNGNPADPAGTIDPTVYVDQGGGEVQAWDGATFSAPWNGPGSVAGQSGAGDPYCYRDVTLDQTGTFPSEQQISVHVNLNTSTGGWGHVPWGHFPWGHPGGGVSSVDIYYDFYVEDVTAPNLLTAEAIDQFTVRLTFDEAMAVSGVGSALVAGSYSFTRQNVDPYPAVNVEAESVAEVAGSAGTQFDITLDWEMTPGQSYLVTVDVAVTDTSGNAIDSRTDTFVGFQPTIPEKRQWSHWRMMVPLINRLEDSTRDCERFSRCVEEVMLLLTHDVDRFVDQFDSDLATDQTIDLMLWDMGNPFDWAELELTENQRRKLLRVLIEIYKLKGTARGVEEVVFFLLGEVVEVVEFLADGWVLGVDELGEASVATIFTDTETFDFSAVPEILNLEIDGTATSVTFEASDFSVPASATAEEVVTALNAKLSVGSAYRDVYGTPAFIVGSNTETFALSGAETLEIEANGISYSVVMRADDFASPGAATAQEVAARIVADTAGNVVASDSSGAVRVETAVPGASSSIEVTAGTAAAVLGLATGVPATGTDAERVAIYSPTAGVDAEILATGGSAKTTLGLGDDPASGTGGAILAPSIPYALYSFDIETASALDDETTAIVRRIAEYMKPAHTHLVNIRTARELPWPDGWELCIDELDETTELAS